MSREANDHGLIDDFLLEAEEHLDRVDDAILDLEKQRSPNGTQAAQLALRSLHSIKGTAGYVSLFDIQDLCHASESILHQFLAAPSRAKEHLDVVFDAVAVLRERFAELRDRARTGELPPESARFKGCLIRARVAAAGGSHADGASS